MSIRFGRDFPSGLNDLNSWASFGSPPGVTTSLAVACDCAIRGMDEADETLDQIIEQHADWISERRMNGLSKAILGEDEAINPDRVLARVTEAIEEIVGYHQRAFFNTEEMKLRLKDLMEKEEVSVLERKSLIQAFKDAQSEFLDAKRQKIQECLESKVRPVLDKAAKAWLPERLLDIPVYFMARAVLWSVSPEIAHKHEALLIDESKEW